MTAHWIVHPHATSIAEWIAANLEQSTCQLGRDAGTRGRLLVLNVASPADRERIEAHIATIPANPDPLEIFEPPFDPTAADPSGCFGGTMARLTYYSRNTVAWIATRSWSRSTRKADIAALKSAKRALDPATIDAAARDLASVLARQVGRDASQVCVTHVACGHSQRPDCFACRVAQGVAQKLGMTFRKVFRDRFVKGVSHPKEFAKLAPIEIAELPTEPLVLVIDDVATSGWHMEEALTTLRSAGVVAQGAVWVSGNVE